MFIFSLKLTIINDDGSMNCSTRMKKKQTKNENCINILYVFKKENHIFFLLRGSKICEKTKGKKNNIHLLSILICCGLIKIILKKYNSIL
jgi:hypothetical protein